MAFTKTNYSQCFTPTINQNDTVICSGDNIILSTQQYDSYQWYYSSSSGSVGNAIGGETNQTYSATGYGYYTVEAKLGPCLEFTNTVFIDEYVFQYPYIASAAQSNFCLGDSTLIELGGSFWTNINWYKDGSVISGANDTLYWVMESGNYVVTASPQQCPNIQMGSGVGPTFYFHAPIIPTINFDGTVLSSSNSNSYQWSLNQTQIPGANQQFYTPVSNGYYSVTTTDDNGCFGTSDSIEVILQTDFISEFNEETIILQSSNTLELNGFENIHSIELYNLNGSKIWTKIAPGNIISISQLNPGMYFLIVREDNEKVIRKKIIKT